MGPSSPARPGIAVTTLVLATLFCLLTARAHGEFGLRRSPGRMDKRGRGGLADVDEDLG